MNCLVSSRMPFSFIVGPVLIDCGCFERRFRKSTYIILLTVVIFYSLCCSVLYMALCSLCRYLALTAALASEADWMFIPECPPEKGWEDLLCKKLAQVRNLWEDNLPPLTSKTRRLQLIWHNFTNSQYLLIIFLAQRDIIQFSVDYRDHSVHVY